MPEMQRPCQSLACVGSTLVVDRKALDHPNPLGNQKGAILVDIS